MAEPFFKIPATDEEVMEDLERISRNVREVQAETLRKILERNANVEYLQRHGLNARTDEASFKACVPVSTFADIADYVDRIADGDVGPLLCADPITSFSLSSGTSGGKSKMIPRTANTMGQVQKAGKIGSLFRRRAYPRRLKTEKPMVMTFTYAGRQFDTKSGLKAGTGTTIFLRSDAFIKATNTPFAMASPKGVVLGHSVPQQMYCHLLCGLYHSQQVETIGAIFAYMIVEPFRLLERVSRDICRDIREGTVNHEHVSDPALRASVEEFLAPNPEQGEFVERECEKGWAGIIERLFPNVNYIISIYSGSMSSYIAPMQVYAGSVPLMNGDYGSSESWIAVNLHPRAPVERASYTIIPDFAYFEFIPVHRDSTGSEFVENAADIVGLADVKVDQEYEIVLTTCAGLYRYRQGDILRVTGFWNGTPEVAFVCRKGVVLSVNTDKTDEEELRLVVEKASKEAAVEAVEFTSYANLDAQPGHYEIFWELQTHEHLNEAAIQECCRILDRSFNDPYMRGRAARTIGPLELRVVKDGAFARLMDHFVRERGVGASQYKTPRCLTNPVSLQLLRDETIFSTRSPEFPVELSAAWRPSDRTNLVVT
jgi:hypothetical protein